MYCRKDKKHWILFNVGTIKERENQKFKTINRNTTIEAICISFQHILKTDSGHSKTPISLNTGQMNKNT